MLSRIAILVVGFAIGLAPQASAATVGLEPVQYCVDALSSCRYMSYDPGVVLVYAGEPGEPNRASVRREGDVLTVADLGATLHAGAGCVTSPDGVARCAVVASRPLVGYRLDGGDGPDAIAVQSPLSPAAAVGQPRVLLGGAGDDVLVAGADADTLVGGPGADQLVGGGGDDRFFAILGGTHATVDGSEPDVADGGPGLDTADYSLRDDALRIDLDGPAAGGGRAGERDRLSSVEQVLGGAGDDVLIGSDGPDRLEGRAGSDRLAGGGGDDSLIGGLGSDILSGGAGDDRLGTGQEGAGLRAPGGDRARCGTGAHDVVGQFDDGDLFGASWTPPDANDAVGLDCEQVRVSRIGDEVVDRVDPRPLRRSRRAWTVRNPCVNARGVVRCTGQIRLTLPSRTAVLAQASLGSRQVVVVRLGPKAARTLRRATRVGVRIDVRARARFHRRQPIALTLALR